MLWSFWQVLAQLWPIHVILLIFKYIISSTCCFLILNSFYFFIGSNRVWTQGTMLAREVVYHLNHTFSPILNSYDDAFVLPYEKPSSRIFLYSFQVKYGSWPSTWNVCLNLDEYITCLQSQHTLGVNRVAIDYYNRCKFELFLTN
jgi:hypothetical protein